MDLSWAKTEDDLSLRHSQFRGAVLDIAAPLHGRAKDELGGDDVVSKAEHMRANIIPALDDVRDVVDRLERVVPDDLWPVPTYRDMLFVK